MRAAIDESVDDFSTIQQPHNKLKLFHLSSETTVSSAHTRDCNRSNLMNVFQVFITSLNLTCIKNEFNYIFALITLKCIIGEVFALCALCMCVCVCVLVQLWRITWQMRFPALLPSRLLFAFSFSKFHPAQILLWIYANVYTCSNGL